MSPFANVMEIAVPSENRARQQQPAQNNRSHACPRHLPSAAPDVITQKSQRKSLQEDRAAQTSCPRRDPSLLFPVNRRDDQPAHHPRSLSAREPHAKPNRHDSSRDEKNRQPLATVDKP